MNISKETINHVAGLSETYGKLYNNKAWSDVTLVVGGQEFYGHRIILANRSKFFKNLFSCKVGENKFPLEIPIEVFELILLYIYQGEICLVSTNITVLVATYAFSHLFDLENLETDLIETFARRINKENWTKMMKTVDSIDSKELMEKCWIFVDTKWRTEFLKSSSFLDLTVVQVDELLSRKTFHASNIRKFEGISEWLKTRPKVAARRLLQHVDPMKLTNYELTKIVWPTALITDYEILCMLNCREQDVLHESCVDDNDVVIAAEVVVGLRAIKNIYNGEYRDGNYHVVYDLGSIKQINNLKFELKETYFRYTDYTISISCDNIEWKTFPQVEFCLLDQNYYFPEGASVDARFVRVSGKIQLNNMRISLATTVPPMNCEFICPNFNVMNSDMAVVHGEDITEYNMFDSSTEMWTVVTDRIKITFMQPYFLTQLRIHLPEQENSLRVTPLFLDNRSVDYNYWERIDTHGMQYFTLSGAVRGFRISSESTKYKLVILRIEAFGQ